MPLGLLDGGNNGSGQPQDDSSDLLGVSQRLDSEWWTAGRQGEATLAGRAGSDSEGQRSSDSVSFTTNLKFITSFNLLMVKEGGYVEDLSGGPTNAGITLKSYREWAGEDKTKEDLKNLTVGKAAYYYHEEYWLKLKCNDLPDGINLAIFDASVHHGKDTAVKMLQRILDVAVDGIVGPETISISHQSELYDVLPRLGTQRILYVQKLPEFKKIGKGWVRRIVAATSEAYAIYFYMGSDKNRPVINNVGQKEWKTSYA